jgi:threonyl-tRNA synthetase
MELFHFQEEAPGMVFWHPNGWTIYRALEDYMRRRLDRAGYKEIKTPQVVDRKLWEASGHWDKYRENMFITEIDEEHANEKRTNALKPMNCPCHVQVFNQGLKSYRDLPLRLAEFGSCHRYEAHGALHGLMRVRGFTQDDAHIFCTEDQIEPNARPSSTFCRASTAMRVSPASTSSSRPGPTCAWAPTRSGTRPKARWKRRSCRSATTTRSTRAKARSTAPSSTSS